MSRSDSRALAAQLKRPDVRALVDVFSRAENPRVRLTARRTALHGQVVVITGVLPTLSRKEAERLIEAAGGTVAPNVTAKTSFVVAGENAGEKLARARSLGVRVVDEAELRSLTEEPAPTAAHRR